MITRHDVSVQQVPETLEQNPTQHHMLASIYSTYPYHTVRWLLAIPASVRPWGPQQQHRHPALGNRTMQHDCSAECDVIVFARFIMYKMAKRSRVEVTGKYFVSGTNAYWR